MNRGGPLKRTSRLVADPAKTRAWQDRSRKALPQRSAKKAAARPAELAVTQIIYARDGGCILRTAFDPGRRCEPGDAMSPHHLEKSSAGGVWSEDNLVALHVGCNGWVEDEPEQARAIGLVVRRGITPGEAWDRRVAHGLVVRTERPE